MNHSKFLCIGLFRTLLFALLLLFSSQFSAQTVFWSDNFDAPAGGANNNNAGVGWTGSMNTPGGGPNTDLAGFTNSWTIGSGGACVSGNSLYMGNSFSPGNAYISDFDTDKLNATPNISTVGISGISLEFTWRCDGVPGQDYGQVGFSSNGGANWDWLSQEYSGQETCIQQTIAIPQQYQGIPNFKIAFRFISNSTSCSTCDPPFNIDNIILTGNSSTCTPPTVNAGSNVNICAGESIAIGGNPTASGGSESGAFVYTWSPAAGLSSTTIANPNASPITTTTYTVSVHRGTPACAASSQVTVTVSNPLPLSISPAGPLTICPGESVSLTASAGFTNYSWSLPSGASTSGSTLNASSLGSYSVSATGSNNCVSTSSPLIIQGGNSDVINVTPSGPLSFCSGQEVVLTAEDGYSNYQWSDGSTGQTITVTESGTYFVSAEGGSCGGVSEDVEITVTSPTPLLVTPSGSVSVCQGETVTLQADEGYTNYVWSNNETGSSLIVSSPGAYSVSATDNNGCNSISAFVNVSYLPIFTVGITPSGVIDICDGQPITLTAQSGFSNYEWSNLSQGPTLTVSSSGFYSVSAENNQGCSGSSNAVIVNFIENSTASFSYVQTDVPIYTVQFTSTEVADEYLWDFGQGATSTEASPSYTFPFDGVYPVTLTITNSCGTTSVTLNVEVIKTSINDFSFDYGLNFNAVNVSQLQITGVSKSQKTILIEVLNTSGQLIQSNKLKVNGEFFSLIDLSANSSGVYIIRMSDDKGSMARKWVK